MTYKPYLLKIVDVFKDFTQDSYTIPILTAVSYTFSQGHSYALTGPSGSGKSTLLHILAGIEKPTAGSVRFNDRDVALFSESERATFLQQHIGLLFQMPYLINELSVLENTMIKGLIEGQNHQEATKKAYELLEHVEMSHKSTAFPASLSGGEQQRVALARALFSNPTFILADEPTAHLDKRSKHHIIDQLIAFQRTAQAGLIIASHDDELIDALETTLILKDKQLIERTDRHGGPKITSY